MQKCSYTYTYIHNYVFKYVYSTTHLCLCVYVCMYMYVCNTFTPQIKGWYITDVPQLAVVHNLCSTVVVDQIFTPFQQKFTISNNRISQQQLWNAINIAVIVLYFGFTMYLTWYFCNHVLC